ncbi:Dephospho-CoA kinase [subsurface metagenome]
MKVIGLTGGIGSGKSAVSRFLAGLGASVIDADRVGHDVLRNPEIRREIAGAFGKQVVTTGGEIDRSRLGEAVFGNTEALERLNKITHPGIRRIIEIQFNDMRQRGVRVVVLEAPLLVEADWASTVDEVWVVVAPEAAVIERLRERSGLSEAESLARIRSQISSEARAKHADVVIDNNGNLDELKAKVEALWQHLDCDA